MQMGCRQSLAHSGLVPATALTAAAAGTTAPSGKAALQGSATHFSMVAVYCGIVGHSLSLCAKSSCMCRWREKLKGSFRHQPTGSTGQRGCSPQFAGQHSRQCAFVGSL